MLIDGEDVRLWHIIRLHPMARTHDGGWRCRCGRRWRH